MLQHLTLNFFHMEYWRYYRILIDLSIKFFNSLFCWIWHKRKFVFYTNAPFFPMSIPSLLSHLHFLINIFRYCYPLFALGWLVPRWAPLLCSSRAFHWKNSRGIGVSYSYHSSIPHSPNHTVLCTRFGLFAYSTAALGLHLPIFSF
jgi:hypothetical protein